MTETGTEPTSEAAARIAQRLGFCEEGSRMKDADGIDRDGNGKLMFPEYVAANKATPEGSNIYDEQCKAALEFINATPVVQSCLYDLGMLPEQLQCGSKEWDRMMVLVFHFREAINAREAADLIESLVQKKGDTSVPVDSQCESPPETEGSWEMRCATLYQVLGALSLYSGTFGTEDIDNALDVACGRGDVDALIPWPKDIARFDALEKLTTGTEVTTK